MQIIKKDGRVVDFINSKLITSIENAADDVPNCFLNESDIKLVLDDLMNILEKLHRHTTSSYEVKSIVFENLLKNGYKDIALAYILG